MLAFGLDTDSRVKLTLQDSAETGYVSKKSTDDADGKVVAGWNFVGFVVKLKDDAKSAAV
jgi:hypothetical protein